MIVDFLISFPLRQRRAYTKEAVTAQIRSRAAELQAAHAARLDLEAQLQSRDRLIRRLYAERKTGEAGGDSPPAAAAAGWEAGLARLSGGGSPREAAVAAEDEAGGSSPVHGVVSRETSQRLGGSPRLSALPSAAAKRYDSNSGLFGPASAPLGAMTSPYSGTLRESLRGLMTKVHDVHAFVAAADAPPSVVSPTSAVYSTSAPSEAEETGSATDLLEHEHLAHRLNSMSEALAAFASAESGA